MQSLGPGPSRATKRSLPVRRYSPLTGVAASSQKSSPTVPSPQIPHAPYFRVHHSPLHSPSVKLTVAHDSTKEAVKQAVNRGLDDIFHDAVSLPVKLVEQQRSWAADTLTFSLIAKMGPMGLMSTPIFGTVLVTDHDLTIDVNLGILERLIPADKARQALSSRIKGLLK